MKSYCIRSDYRPNPADRTLDSVSDEVYWNEERIRASSRYQYDAYRAARQLAARAGARTILDLGCGPATKLNLFFGDGYELVGVDQPSAIELCRRLHARGTYIADRLDHPGPDLAALAGKIDLLIASDVIEHLDDPDRLLDTIRRVASPSTIIVLTTPDRVALLGPDALSPVNPAHVREWSFDEFRRYIDTSGFTVVEHRRFPPFRFALDRMTARFILKQVRTRLPLATNQMIVCKRHP